MRRKIKVLSLIGVSSVAMLVALIGTNGNFKFSFLNKAKADNSYSLTLNSSNAYDGNSTKTVTTESGAYTVQFSYSGASTYNAGHVSLSDGGTIKNTEQITSITSLTPVFSCSSSASLTFRASFNGTKWGEYTTLTSGSEFSLDSQPYFLEIKATGGTVNITSIKYEYSCIANPNAGGSGSEPVFKKVTSELADYSGTYLVVHENGSLALDSSLSTIDATGNYVSVSISNNEIAATDALLDSAFTIEKMSGSYYSVKTTTSKYIGTISYDNKLNTSDSALQNTIIFDDESAYICSSYNCTLSFNTATAANGGDRFRYYKTPGVNIPKSPLYRLEGTSSIIGTPSYEVGLSISDDKQNQYNVNESFDSFVENGGLTVSVMMSDGTTKALSKTEYSYVVKYNNVEINTNQVFPNAGEYEVTVSYKSLVPSKYTINVINPVTSIVLNKTQLEMDIEDEPEVINATVYPTNATDKTLSWTSSDTSVATVTGNNSSATITPVSTGSATITVSSVNNITATCEVTITGTAPEWTLVTSTSQLVSGSKYVIACNSKDATAGDISSQVMGSVESIFNSDGSKITSLGFDTEILTLGGSSGSWTFANNDGDLLGATAVKKLAWDDGTTTWSISIDSSDNATIQNGTSTYGRFLYNVGSPRFTTYTSATSDTMILPQLYKLSSGSSSGPTEVLVSDINVTPTTKTINVGATVQLAAEVLPLNATDSSITWSSNDTTIATVSSTGLVTGVSAGTTSIIATANDGSGITGSCSITVTNPVVSVTGVTLSSNSETITVGGTATLTATVSPANATNKNISWTSSNTSVATVLDGVVTGVSAGSAVITVTTSDGNKTATCAITVQSSGSQLEGQDFEITFVNNGSDSGTEISSANFDNEVETGSEYVSWYNSSKAYGGANGIKLGSSKSTGSITMSLSSAVSENNATSITYTIVKYGNEDPSSKLSVNGTAVQTQSTAGTFTYTCPSNTKVNTIKFESTKKRIYVSGFTISCVPAAPVNPTGISIPSTASVGVNGTTSLEVSYLPSNCNTNKGVTWTSSNTNIATVASNGTITGVAAGTCSITARSTFNTSFTSSCTLTVTEQQLDKWTILLYMCGSDLESGGGGQATADLNEIKSVNNQPADVNFVVETGGAKDWSNNQNGCIDASKLSRFHLRNKSFVSDEKITYASMGLSSTLQSFIEYGVNNYPAQKYALILWNHGGGQWGVCYDEKKSDDSLLDNEVRSAVSGAFNNTGVSKFEFIGYDACLMQLMEIAEMNSPYFNYQVGSQESENGTGWDYDTWLDNVYNNDTTPNILKAICDGFIQDNGGVNAVGDTYYTDYTYTTTKYYPADQTLSYLDLSQMSAFKTAWESMAGVLKNKITNSNKSSFNTNIIGKTKYFAGDDYDYFCTFDAYHFLTLLENNSTFNPGASYISSVKTAFNNLVKYNLAQREAASDAHGLCFFYTAGTGYGQSTYNSSTYSNFANWIEVAKNGGSITSSWSY